MCLLRSLLFLRDIWWFNFIWNCITAKGGNLGFNVYAYYLMDERASC